MRPGRWHWVALALLTAFALGFGARRPWAGAASVLVPILFLLVGGAVLPGAVLRSRTDEDAPIGALRVTLLCIGGGLVAFFAVVAVAAYSVGIRTGALATLALAAAGALRLWRTRAGLLGFASSPVVFWTTAIAIAVGLHVLGFNEVRLDGWLYYTFRYDWDFHLSLAALIRDHGLPMADMTWTSDGLRNTLVHTGLPTLVAAIDSLTRTGVYHGARTLGIVAFCLIAWSTLVLVNRLCVGPRTSVLAAVSPLILGGLTLPFALLLGRPEAIFDPYFDGLVRGTLASGSLYHNQTQNVAVAILMMGLVAMDSYRRGRQSPTIILAALLVVLSGVVKPSTLIVTAPAWILVMIAKREGVAPWAALAAALALGFAYHLAPLWVDSGIHRASTWTLAPAYLVHADEVAGRLLAAGIGWLVIGRVLAGMAGRLRVPRDWSWYEVQAIALLGAVLFSFLFYEPERESHANQLWPMGGALITLSGLVVATTTAWVHRLAGGGWRMKIGGAVLAALLGFQLLGGTIYAVRYPFFNVARQPEPFVSLVNEAGRATPPGTHFLLPPKLTAQPLLPYLARPWRVYNEFVTPAALQRAMTAPQGRIAGELQDLFEGRRAVLVHRSDEDLQRFLLVHRWSREPLASASEYELWLRRPDTIPDGE